MNQQKLLSTCFIYIKYSDLNLSRHCRVNLCGSFYAIGGMAPPMQDFGGHLRTSVSIMICTFT